MVELKAGDVLCTATPVGWSPISWLCGAIRKVTGSAWSHCAVVVELWGRLYVAEALATGIVVRPLADWPRDVAVCVMRPVGQVDVPDFCTRAMSKVGHTGYDYSSLLWYQLVYQLTGHWIGRTSASRKAADRLYCSEYVGWLYQTEFPRWWCASPKDVRANVTGFSVVFEGDATELQAS